MSDNRSGSSEKIDEATDIEALENDLSQLESELYTLQRLWLDEQQACEQLENRIKTLSCIWSVDHPPEEVISTGAMSSNVSISTPTTSSSGNVDGMQKLITPPAPPNRIQTSPITPIQAHNKTHNLIQTSPPNHKLSTNEKSPNNVHNTQQFSRPKVIQSVPKATPQRRDRTSPTLKRETPSPTLKTSSSPNMRRESLSPTIKKETPKSAREESHHTAMTRKTKMNKGSTLPLRSKPPPIDPETGRKRRKSSQVRRWPARPIEHGDVRPGDQDSSSEEEYEEGGHKIVFASDKKRKISDVIRDAVLASSTTNNCDFERVIQWLESCSTLGGEGREQLRRRVQQATRGAQSGLSQLENKIYISFK
ncbi:hypothetical protein PROFUN_00696 [Planoprotostelium fungivorum]|uniref:Uncharacterized protein n=1 Tax=Planoprotostelium fungivorum TaxID=1890364 RepID=A0A2P6NU32_9EUKA|nr:hypothetical protein PROFUN_00696 [Planoprotostelium fungivorum]